MALSPPRTESVVLVECVACAARREIHIGDFELGGLFFFGPEEEPPICHECGMPMITVQAERREARQ